MEVSGTCTENVVIRQSGIRLLAPSGAVIVAADASDQTILVVGRNATVDNFTIKGGRNGISVVNSGSATITNNHITENPRGGIVVTRTSFGRIENNVIDANGFDGNGAPVSRGHGIFVGMSSSAQINGNTIDANGDVGVRVAGASNARLSDNNITDNEQEGLDVTLGSNVRLSDGTGGPNLIQGNGDFGWKCRINSSIWPVENQNFGSGNAPLNTSIQSGCVKQGGFF